MLSGEWMYDVRLVSKKLEWVKYKEEPWYRLWLKVTAKRIDAVCIDEAYVNIIEVKRYMLASGVGQLLLYKKMYQEQYKPKKPIRLWLIAYYPDPDVIELCDELGIATWSVVKL